MSMEAARRRSAPAGGTRGGSGIPFRALGASAILLAGLISSTNARGAEAASTNEFLSDLPTVWTRAFEVRTSVGYKDNLLLSSTGPESSWFLGTGADVVVARLPLDGRQLTFLLSADDRRYLDGRQVDHEDLVLALTQFKLDFAPGWRAGLDARYLFQDEVVDTSVTETNLQATLVRGHLAGLLPNVRWDFARRGWVEASGTAQRGWYEAPLDDYWEGGPKLTIGHDYGQRSSLQLSYGFNRRDYDTREQTSLSGTNLPGTALRFVQNEVALVWRHEWDAARRWRTGLRLALQSTADNGPGYYDSLRYGVAPQVRYVAAAWELKAEARFNQYDFDRQPANPDSTSPGSSEVRAKGTLTFNLRGERKLWKGLKLFAEFEHEQSFSNRATDEYRVNTVAGGGLWEF